MTNGLVEPIDAFISYAQADFHACQDVFAALDRLKEEVVFWYDRQLAPGASLTKEIQSKLSTAPLVVVLASVQALASPWVAKEVRRALDRSNKREARLIPVILQDCEWKQSPLKELLALPSNGRPLDQWKDRAQGIADIVRGVIAATQECRRPARSPELAIFETDDLRQMIGTIDRSLRVIRRENDDQPRLPAQVAIEIDRLLVRRKKYTDELTSRDELL
jgi:hypothetical protein